MRRWPFLLLLGCAAPPAPVTDPAAPPPASPAPPAASGPTPPILEAHNRARAAHCAPPLRWSDELASRAQRWADELARRGCSFEHSGGTVGENLAAGTAGALDPDGVVGMWYDEASRYDFRRGGFSMQTGHFTQLVWASTTHVGCGTRTCKGLDLWVCNYAPPGNVEGEYRANVKPRCR